MSNLRRVGKEAEDRAADFLLSLGYTVVTRRYKARHGEVDIVCLDDEVLVFVEVKERNHPDYSPEEAIGRNKIDALLRAINEYLLATGEKRETRIDVVAMDPSGLRHHIDILRA